MSTAIRVTVPRTLSPTEIRQLDPYTFFAVLGKRVIHPGGWTATDALIGLAGFGPGQRVLDVGCGVGTTAIRIAGTAGARVTAIDIARLMLERATANVARAGLSDRVTFKQGDITNLCFAEGSFD